MSHESNQTHSRDPILDEASSGLTKGFLDRSSVLSYIYAAAFTAYAFTSFEYLNKYLSSLTILDNLWPRIIFNTLPLLILGFFLRSNKISITLRTYLWAVGMPIVFTGACLIYTWPTIWSGNSDLYLYVHAPNIFIIVTSLIVVTPPPRILLAQVSAYLLLFVLPLFSILIYTQRFDLLKWALNDLVLALGISIYTSLVTHKLRLKLLISEIQKQKDASSFLGSAVAKAIFQEKSDLLKNRHVDALVVKMDIRGSTPFANNNEEEIVANFMSDYSNIVSHAVGSSGGFWNKSIGDGHLITFGAMDAESDLSDIPGIDDELRSAENRQKLGYFARALKAMTTIAYEFERLKEKYDVQEKLSLGMAIDYGKVLLRLQGDATHRTELDIGGRVIYRCTRLEEYTKVIQSSIGTAESVLVLSPVLEEFADSRMFTAWSIAESSKPVRDYPDIQKIHYHTFRDRGERRNSIIKLRAS